MGKFTNQEGLQGRTLTKISIALNLVFICGTILLTVLLVRKGYIGKILSRLNLREWNYADNAVYDNYTAVYPLYSEQKNIVMLGNSLTSCANWAELLNRPDVAARGIGGDVTAGFIRRLNCIISIKPKICFIEGGVNDLMRRVSQDTILKNLASIIDTLQKNDIKPVLTTVTLLAQQCKSKNPVEQNKKIKELNEQIFKLAKEKNISLIDLNQYVSNNDFLISEDAVKDGLHFTRKTYEVWKCEVEKILEQEGI
jgi:lysophospholipase L1-like esterase